VRGRASGSGPLASLGGVADFDDLLTANRSYAASLDPTELDALTAPADAKVAVVTCMDSRIDPLAMLGLGLGEAKVIRNPGGRVTPSAMEALVLATNLLGCERVMLVEHTRCAVASNTEEQIREQVSASCGHDAAWQAFGVTADQDAALAEDVHRVRAHPLVPDSTEVGGFLYDVATGLLERKV